MSWLARTIANSLRFDDVDSSADANPATAADPSLPHKAKSDDSLADGLASPLGQTPRGVKEDLTELKMTLTRQLWDVASFLAPPPDTSPSPPERSAGWSSESTPQPGRSPSPWDSADREASDDEALIAGIRSDFAEIGGKFRSGISKLSKNKTVWEFTKIASNFLQLGAESEHVDTDLVGNTVGVTEEALAFARNIAMHPKTWLDFPIANNDDDSDDFELTYHQQEHALAIEHLARRLGALRIELCPGYMSEASFWKIYFVLLHPRLSKHDAGLLSTPQILEARAMLMQELQSRNKAMLESDLSAAGASLTETTDPSREEPLPVVPSTPSSKSFHSEPSLKDAPDSIVSSVVVRDKHPVQNNQIQIMDKSIVNEELSRQTTRQHSYSRFSSRALDDNYEDGNDDWLEGESVEIAEDRGIISIPIENDEDVSFSDLEDDDDNALASYKKVADGSDSSAKDSRDWIQLGGSSNDSGKESKDAKRSRWSAVLEIEIKESNDWLDIDDIDEV
ncbi:hypothetical protein SAY87_009138 [Trapa incisa]|uniref:BSD domain-containing protein n=1 Tax=Trapa incisa TaxID=236973 RepID=A0AAN7JX46_9MYRT|nr:hypothetical protein SAY87_009138 [Trapa incisa]